MGKMHECEVAIDAVLVRRLLRRFPQWADLPLTAFASAGTDNALYRLGDDMVVRLPRIEPAARQVGKEHEWLPKLAPHLPLEVPVPLAQGAPGDGYPWAWAVYRWIPGEAATSAREADPRRGAEVLAEFVRALQAIDPAGAPAPGDHNAGRGEPLANRDDGARAAIDALRGTIDAGGATATWEASLETRVWPDAGVWIHGDLLPTNLLVDGGRLRAVIDFGSLGAGDPACDVMAAWTVCDRHTRPAFRSILEPDDDTWVRGRGWALSFGLIALPYYRETNRVLASVARRAIDEALGDFRRAG